MKSGFGTHKGKRISGEKGRKKKTSGLSDEPWRTGRGKGVEKVRTLLMEMGKKGQEGLVVTMPTISPPKTKRNQKCPCCHVK